MPAATPITDDALRQFLTHFHLDVYSPPEQLLRQVIAAFARLPYENLTKIIKESAVGRTLEARRTPAEVIADHVAWGAGGTCFSLTWTLLHLLRSLGWTAEPILADRPYGPDTHCALLVWIDGRPHLIDPGYLLTEPIPLDATDEQRIPTTFHEVRLTPRADGSKLELATVQQGHSTQRLTFKTSPVDAGAFARVWDASFAWDMMRYPLLSHVVAGQHLYLRGNRLQTRSAASVSRIEVAPAELVRRIHTTFGIDAGVVQQALTLLHRSGEKHG